MSVELKLSISEERFDQVIEYQRLQKQLAELNARGAQLEAEQEALHVRREALREQAKKLGDAAWVTMREALDAAILTVTS